MSGKHHKSNAALKSCNANGGRKHAERSSMSNLNLRVVEGVRLSASGHYCSSSALACQST